MKKMNVITIGLAIMALQACASAPAPAPSPTLSPTPAAAKPAVAPAAAAPAATGTSFLLTSYAAGKKVNQEGAAPVQVSYSEKKGDAFVASLDVVDGAAVIKGQLGNVRGSGYAGIAMVFPHGRTPDLQNLSGYKTVKIRVASPTVNTLRLRISGGDQKTLDAGCYPVFMLQGVTATMTEYSIPVARFEPEQYCGDNARKINDTITAVSGFEVADTKQTNKPTEVRVERIEFVN
jgi:hypothetical protein